MRDGIRHSVLARCGVAHAFGTRSARRPPGLLLPRQLHGALVAQPDDAGGLQPPAADAVVSTTPGLPVGVQTADCVPILAASSTGNAVAAIHAGWRGLAAGVVSAGLSELRARADSEALRAAIGPHIGPCCYEVDDPVVDALRERFSGALASALRPSRPGHAYLDLAVLVEMELETAGVSSGVRGVVERACTCCHEDRFYSYRRDGARAGRLVHHVAASLDSPPPWP